jgi:RimK family alpha-L-glutamate ligase
VTVHILGAESEGNLALARGLRAAGVDARILAPAAAERLARGDVVLNRLDVLPTLDGVERGLDVAVALRARGARVVNGAEALLNAHDKLRTAAILFRAGVPHPRTMHARTLDEARSAEPPAVLKPRFGSWGRDVFLCRTRRELDRRLGVVAARRWFARHGVLVQDVVDAEPRDVRVVVAGGTIVGAGERRARPGEWRTNVSLGGSLRPTVPPPAAAELALATATCLGTDLVGVDVLIGRAGPVVIEANGAVDFDDRYALPGDDLYRRLADALDLPRGHLRERRETMTTTDGKIEILAPDAASALVLEQRLLHLAPTTVADRRTHTSAVHLEGGDDVLDEVLVAVRHWLRDLGLRSTEVVAAGVRHDVRLEDEPPAAEGDALGAGYEGVVLLHEP